MSNVPVISIDSAAVWYGPSGSEMRTGIRATPEQLAKIAYGIGVALGRLGGAQHHVETVDAKYIFSRGGQFGLGEERFFNVRAVVKGPDKKQTKIVKVHVPEREAIDDDCFARELHAALLEPIREFVSSARSDLEYWSAALRAAL